MRAGRCKGSHVETFSCNDPSHDHFWWPENWPGGRAPARVEYMARSVAIVSLWSFGAGGEGRYELEVTSSGVPHDAPTTERIVAGAREAERVAGLMEAKRDSRYAGYRELEEAREQGMAVPG